MDKQELTQVVEISPKRILTYGCPKWVADGYSYMRVFRGKRYNFGQYLDDLQRFFPEVSPFLKLIGDKPNGSNSVRRVEADFVMIEELVGDIEE